MIINQMFEVIEPLLERIYLHPFNQQLASGVLAEEKFIDYLQQDSLYLADFSRALAITASRLELHSHVQQFLQFALDAINAERELHGNYLSLFSRGDASHEPQNLACFTYTNYLLKMACLAPVEEAVASLLPCFYIYHQVGMQMAKQASPDNPYYQWITPYSGDLFQTSVNKMISIVNTLAQTTSQPLQTKMIAAFKKSSQLEWIFWSAAFNQDTWPI